MKLVVLFHDELLTLATTQKVIPADEAAVLVPLLEQSEQLAQRLAQRDKELEQARLKAESEGYESGFVQGREAGLQAAKAELELAHQQLDVKQTQIQQDATRLAIELIKKMADTIDPAELISSLAIAAASSYSPDEPLVLRVHEQVQQAVADRIEHKSTGLAVRFVQIKGDSSVDPMACLIESPEARLLADLGTQTGMLEAHLVNG